MPSKFKTRKGKEIINILLEIGFVVVSQKGSHIKLSINGRHIVVPNHNELAIGTLNEIYKMARDNTNDSLVNKLFLV